MARQHDPAADRHLAEAEKLTRSGQIEAAKRLYGQIIARYPQNKKARKALKALQGREGAALSREDFDRVMRLASRGKLDAACADASELVRLHPNQPALLNLLGVLRARQGKQEMAVENYRKALALQPDFNDALNNLAAAYAKLGQAQQAEACYYRLLQATPRDPEAWYNLGNAQRSQQQFEEAAKSYRHAIKLRPFFAEAFHNLGNTYIDLGQPEQAVECYQDALGIRDDFHRSRRKLGSTYLGMGRYMRAASCYKQLVEHDASDADALLGLANAENALGQTTAAVENYTRVLELKPNSNAARHNLDALQHRRSARAPEEYVRGLFDNYAPGFEKHLTEGLGYSAPRVLRSLCEQLDMGAATGGRAIDLGCGTGLGGEAFSDLAGSITGVDLATKMLREAEKKGVYADLVLGDIVKVLKERDEVYDLALCCDTLVYIGDLQPLLRALGPRLGPNGRFLLTTEHLAEGDYELLPSGRYAHSHDYVVETATRAGLELLHFEESPLRKERGEWLTGGLYCFAKPAA